jgi:hypothetical protein
MSDVEEDPSPPAGFLARVVLPPQPLEAPTLPRGTHELVPSFETNWDDYTRYYKYPEDATRDRNFQSDRFGKPYQSATDIIDQAQDKLVNALVYAFTAHMGAKEALLSADMDEFSKAQVILNEAKKSLKDDFKEVYNTLAINDAAILIILNKINRELHNIKIDDDDDDPSNKIDIKDIISTIVNENIRNYEIIHTATKRRLSGGKKHRTKRTKRTHRKNRTHRTNRKYRINRKTRKN